MKLLGPSLLCFGLMMAEGAKEGQGQVLPTSDHCSPAPECRHPSTPSSVLVHLSPLILPTPSRTKANFGLLGPAPTRLPPWIGQWRAPGQHSPSQGLGARKGQPVPTPTLTTSTCSVLGTALLWGSAQQD